MDWAVLEYGRKDISRDHLLFKYTGIFSFGSGSTWCPVQAGFPQAAQLLIPRIIVELSGLYRSNLQNSLVDTILSFTGSGILPSLPVL